MKVRWRDGHAGGEGGLISHKAPAPVSGAIPSALRSVPPGPPPGLNTFPFTSFCFPFSIFKKLCPPEVIFSSFFRFPHVPCVTPQERPPQFIAPEPRSRFDLARRQNGGTTLPRRLPDAASVSPGKRPVRVIRNVPRGAPPPTPHPLTLTPPAFVFLFFVCSCSSPLAWAGAFRLAAWPRGGSARLSDPLSAQVRNAPLALPRDKTRCTPL